MVRAALRRGFGGVRNFSCFCKERSSFCTATCRGWDSGISRPLIELVAAHTAKNGYYSKTSFTKLKGKSKHGIA